MNLIKEDCRRDRKMAVIQLNQKKVYHHIIEMSETQGIK
jgi:hypothetical protein